MKLTAAILALALFLQSGCDFWCHHVESVVTAGQSSTIPPCHGAAGVEQSKDGQDSTDPDAPKDCVHPLAAEDGLKLQAKVIKASLPVAIVEPGSVHGHFEIGSFAWSTDFASGIKPSAGPPSLILRI